MQKKASHYSIKGPIDYLVQRSIQLFGIDLVSIVLFGSHARNNYNKYSDFDVIIVLNKEIDYNISKLRKNFLLRFKKRLDLQIFSRDDVINNFDDFSPLFSTLLIGKRILFDKDMFFKEKFEDFVKKSVTINVKYCEGNTIWEIQTIAKNLEISH